MDRTVVRFEYENHRGVYRTRTVFPSKVWFGCTAYYPEARWLLEAFDLDNRAVRDFDMGKVRGWRLALEDVTGPVEPPNPA